MVLFFNREGVEPSARLLLYFTGGRYAQVVYKSSIGGVWRSVASLLGSPQIKTETDFEMAQLTYFQAVDMTNPATWTGDFVVAESTYFGLQGTGNAAVYLGSFEYSNDGIISGVVDAYDLFKGSSLEAQVRGVALDATAVQAVLVQGNHQAIQAAALQGNDLIRGSSQADTLSGLGGDDLIDGLSGNDVLLGGAGSDTLVGGPGNDTLIGGEGLDYAVYAATVNQYRAEVNQDGRLQVTDAIALARDGVDVLESVERLRFHNGDLALDVDGVAGQAYRIYKAAFNRQPDADGLGYWISLMDGGLSLSDAAAGFIGSSEFARLYGPNPSNEQFIDLLYQNVLQRQSDQSGYDFWIQAMNSGVSRAQVLAEFSESPENQANVEPVISNGIFYTPFFG